MKEVSEFDEDKMTISQDLTGDQREPELDDQLIIKQQEDLKALITEFHDVFREVPGVGRGINHQILTLPGQVIHNHWRRLSHHLQPAVKQEIDQMRKLGIIE